MVLSLGFDHCRDLPNGLMSSKMFGKHKLCQIPAQDITSLPSYPLISSAPESSKL